jgi:hypothetical protein
MSDRRDLRAATARVLDRDEVDGVLSSAFYAPAGPERETKEPASTTVPVEKPLHYKVICISMYTEDLKRLDGMVDALKARGLTKANRSALIRYALGSVNLDQVPKGL